MKIKIIILIVIALFYGYYLIEKSKVSDLNSNTPIPASYSSEEYKIASTTDVFCNIDDDCKTPGEYMIRSDCPYFSKCLVGKCNIVCPAYKKNEQK